jgi:hypothetical protein
MSIEKAKPLIPPLQPHYGTSKLVELEKTAAKMRAKYTRQAWTTGRPAFVSEILRRVAPQFGTTPDSIVGIQRHQVSHQKNITAARREIIRELTADPRRFSTTTIGRWLNINHASVTYHLKGWTAPVPQPPTPWDPEAPDESGDWAI